MPLNGSRRDLPPPDYEDDEDPPPPRVVYVPAPKSPIRMIAEMGLIAAGVIALIGAVWVQGQTIAVHSQVLSDLGKRVDRLEDERRPKQP